MTTRLLIEQALAGERQRVQPLAEPLYALVRAHDPNAQFRLRLGRDPEFWEIDAWVKPDLATDLTLRKQLAEIETDILVDHDAAFLVLLHPRNDNASR